MNRRPPRSTRTEKRFPYTPLVRSGGAASRQGGRRGDGAQSRPRERADQRRTPGAGRRAHAERNRVRRPAGPTRGHRAAGRRDRRGRRPNPSRSEEHTSELQSLMRISYAVFSLKKKKKHNKNK